jgi:hypothetical protein
MGQPTDYELGSYTRERAEKHAAVATPAISERRVRHKKRNSTYRVIGSASLQTDKPLSDMQIVVVYQSETNGHIWVRPVSEFEDGRFEELPANTEPGAEEQAREIQRQAIKICGYPHCECPDDLCNLETVGIASALRQSAAAAREEALGAVESKTVKYLFDNASIEDWNRFALAIDALRSSQQPAHEPPGCPTPGACSCVAYPDPAEEIARLLDRFGEHHGWELSCVYGEDEALEINHWAVHKQTGNINDREWTEIGQGSTPAEAIRAALAGSSPAQGEGK